MQRVGIVIFPDVFSVDHTGEEHFLLWKTVFLDECETFLALCKVQTDSIEIQCTSFRVAVTDISKIGLQQHLDILLFREDLLIKLNEESLILCRHIHDQARLIDLHPFCAQ